MIKQIKSLVYLCIASFVIMQSCTQDPIEIINNTPDDLRGTLVSVETLGSYTIEEVDQILDEQAVGALISAKNGVDLLKVTYRTLDKNGNTTYASGALAVPTGLHDTIIPPISTYCHGTSIQESNIPSALNAEINIGIIFASEGFVVTMPDYLGFGASSSIFHTYQISHLEASATIDMIRASTNYMNNNEIAYKNEHYIFGYSQGGHSAMATVKAIEEMESDEINIIAAAPMSGAYDMTGIQATTFTEAKPYDAPYYLPYVLFAYNDVYNLYDNFSDFLVSPYDSTLYPLFDGTHTPYEVNNAMPDTPNQIIQPEVLQDFIDNPDNPLRLALAENDLYDWTPNTDMVIIYCSGDNLVLAGNSELACETFANNGSTAEIECFDGGDLDHGGCVIPALLKARIYFLQLAGII